MLLDIRPTTIEYLYQSPLENFNLDTSTQQLIGQKKQQQDFQKKKSAFSPKLGNGINPIEPATPNEISTLFPSTK